MMTRHEALAPDSTCHPEVWALMPWAVNGTLEGHERRAVEERLATCTSCRAELARCHAVAAAVLAAPAQTWSPSPADVSRILARAGRRRLKTTRSASSRLPPARGWRSRS